MSRFSAFNRNILALFALSLLGMAGLLLFHSLPPQALAGSDFNAGRIIDDGVFFTGGDLSPTQIQQFLAAKVPVCDTNGTQQHSSGTTRAVYGTSRGFPPPYVCLKDYRQDTPNRPYEGGLCNGYNGGNQSA